MTVSRHILGRRLFAFLDDQNGVATIEWLFLSIAVVGLSIPVGAVVLSGSETGSHTVREYIETDRETRTQAALETIEVMSSPHGIAASEAPAGRPLPAVATREQQSQRFRLRSGELVWGDTPAPYGPGVSADVVVTTRRSESLPRPAAPRQMAVPTGLKLADCPEDAPGQSATRTADGDHCVTRYRGLPGL